VTRRTTCQGVWRTKPVGKRATNTMRRATAEPQYNEFGDKRAPGARTTWRAAVAVLAFSFIPVVVLVAIGFFVCCTLFGWSCGGLTPFANTAAEWSDAGKVPSDDQMIRHFLDHEPEFVQLLDGYGEGDLENLGISSVTGRALFIIWRQGWFGGTHEKGYLFSGEEFARDKARDEGSVGYRYVPIKGQWYIYEWLDP